MQTLLKIPKKEEKKWNHNDIPYKRATFYQGYDFDDEHNWYLNQFMTVEIKVKELHLIVTKIS